MWSDGHGYCFTCNTFYEPKYIYSSKNIGITYEDTNQSSMSIDILEDNNYRREPEGRERAPLGASVSPASGERLSIDGSTTYQFIPFRGLSATTMRFFGVKAEINPAGYPCRFVFPYGSRASKSRLVDAKRFWYEGDFHSAKLFGMDKFSAGQAQAVTITEGEFDCMSVYQMLGSKYPVISVKSSSAVVKDIEDHYDYFNSFAKIYLCLDNDQAGQDATKAIARLFDPQKVYHVKLTKHKDANEYLTAGDAEAFAKVWWSSKNYLPAGILGSFTDIEAALQKEGGESIGSYPFPTIERMAYGIRGGEVVLVTAPEKVGKTEFIRAMEYHLLQSTDHNIGIIHLEEEEKRSVLGLIGYHLSIPAHLPDCPLSLADKVETYKSCVRQDGRLFIYSRFGIDDPASVLDVIRYLVGVCHCKFIFFDHITMAVTSLELDDDRKKLDFLSTRLAMMTRELDFSLVLVSHVNDDGKTRGSRNIAKVADLLLHLERDIEAESIAERNRIKVSVRGNRFAGITGSGGTIRFDPSTFKLKEEELILHDERESFPGTP